MLCRDSTQFAVDTLETKWFPNKNVCRVCIVREGEGVRKGGGESPWHCECVYSNVTV